MNDSPTRTFATARPFAWPNGIGEMAARIREHDWAATSLGPIEAWPQTLRTVVDLMLNSRQPTHIVWGPDLRSLYNDSLIPIVGTKHPGALGLPFPEVWAEIWDEYRPVVEATLAGEAQYFVDRPVALAGRPDRPLSWFTFSWTPLRDDTGAVVGFYCAATETTEKVHVEETLRESKEAALRESEASFRALFESIDEGFCIIEVMFDDQDRPVDYRFLEVNPAFERQTGLRDVMGKTMKSLNAAHEAHWFEIYGTIVRTGAPIRFENAAEALGRWYEVYAFPVGRPGQHRVAVLFKDILERRQAEMLLRESEARLSQVQEAGRIGSFDFDRTTGKATASREYLSLYGLPESRSGAFTYNDWLSLVHPEDRPRVESETRAAVADPARSQLDYDFRIIRADTSETRWIAARTRLMRDAEGRFIRSLGAQWDVTEERKAAAALRESEARFRHMADSAPAMIWMTDADGQIIFANMHYDHVFGRPASDMMGQGWRDIVRPEDRPRFESTFADAFPSVAPSEPSFGSGTGTGPCAGCAARACRASTTPGIFSASLAATSISPRPRSPRNAATCSSTS